MTYVTIIKNIQNRANRNFLVIGYDQTNYALYKTRQFLKEYDVSRVILKTIMKQILVQVVLNTSAYYRNELF